MATDQSSPFSRLNDDVLFSIFEAFKKDGPARTGSSDLDSLKALSQCNRRLRQLLVTEVFKNVGFGRSNDWVTAQDMLGRMMHSENVKHYTQHLVVSLLDRRLEDGDAPAALMSDVVRLMLHMNKLRGLAVRFSHRSRQAHGALKQAFESAGNPIFPAIRALETHEELHRLLVHFPNLESITLGFEGGTSTLSVVITEHLGRFISACSLLTRLQHFEVTARWSKERLELVLAAMPGLTSLVMSGYGYRGGLWDLLPTLGKFQRLQTLALAGAQNLGVGFRPPWCGNAYMGPNGAAVRERVDRERLEAEKHAAKMCFEACKVLEVVWIGSGTRATVTRDGKGSAISIDTVSGLQRPSRRKLQ